VTALPAAVRSKVQAYAPSTAGTLVKLNVVGAVSTAEKMLDTSQS
jgi:hypothetical protein